ncbi:unnamed protein product [Ceutorhynchus assimilis]|uniref:DNA polymerase theta n=1 Tax=Ceutorhynchus assimilis TaxID=467358 RepID=A0A9N9MK16_9CUCU|nr:unnamed protein product [Ceutorhynchus assimilis]
MVEDDFFMSDTLDNVSFREIKSQPHNKPDQISFDDSHYLDNFSFDFEEATKNEEKPLTGTNECSRILNETNKNHYDSDTLSGSSSSLILFNLDIEDASDSGIDSVENECTKNSSKTHVDEIVCETNQEKLSFSELTIPETEIHQESPEVSLSNCVKKSPSQNTAKFHNENFKLASWGLPDLILEKYASRKIQSMLPWQFECLNNPKVLNEWSNLIYSAPTSAGKTLVAEILALKTIFERKKKVIFILPFVSIVREKMYYFQDLLSSCGIRTDGFMGSYNPPGGFASLQFAICTIEKANNLINRLLEEGKLSEVGCVLVDEMHLLGDPHRGYILELLLTKLRYIALKDENVKIQIIGMSATLPNLDQLAKWLEAQLYFTDFRPVPLFEQASVGGDIYDKNFQFIKKLEPLPEIDVDTDNILQLCLETIKDSCSVLIFCPTKNWCENLAQQLAAAFWKIGNSQTMLGEVLRSQINTNLILEVFEQLKLCPVGLDEVLKKTVSFGIAFHHAGLTMDERDIIEGAFRNGAIRILIATSTLSSGVNLPARRVLIRSPYFCGKPIDLLTYQQMIGRAGRMGKDTKGESILVCQKNDCTLARELMRGKLPAVESCLEGDGKLKRAILEIIASGVASSYDDVALFASCTLLAVTDKENKFENLINQVLKYLEQYEFIRSDKQRYVTTSLGKACLSSSIAPDEGLALFTELEKARQCFVLETELHLIYLVTPYNACYSWGNIDWMFYMDLWDKLSIPMKRVGQLVGVRESYMIGASRRKMDDKKGFQTMMVHKRFFVALVLQDLVNEVPLGDVCVKYSCNRGMLQSLQQSAATFAGMVTSFSQQLGWNSIEILFSQFQDRMHFGVSRDLLDLMRLPSITGKLARTLYNAGIESLVQLANNDKCVIEKIFLRAGPFESAKDDNKKANLRTIWVTGKAGLTEIEAAELLINEARNYLVIEMGLKEAKWKSQASQNLNKSNVSMEKSNSEIDDLEKKSSTPIIVSSINLNDIAPEGNNKKTKNTAKPLEISDILNSNSSLELNLSTSSQFSCLDNTGFNKNINTDKSLTDDESFSLLDNDLNKCTNHIETIAETENFFEVSQPTSKRKLNSPKTEASFASSDDSVLEATPTKKPKILDLLNTPISLLKNCETSFEEEDLFAELEIVDVASDELLKTFFKELNDKSCIAFCVACIEKIETKPVIGGKVIGNEKTISGSECISYKDKKVHGFTFCWGNTQSYFLSADNNKILKKLKEVFANKQKCIRMFNAKEQIKILKLCCDIDFGCKIEDPKIADWLLNPEGNEKSFQTMINNYDERLQDLGQLCSDINCHTSIGLNVKSSTEPKLRASIDAVVTWHLVEAVRKELAKRMPKFNEVNYSCFPSTYDLEMRIIISVANMELCGMSADKIAWQNLVDLLKKQQYSIEKKAFSLAGRRFNFNSPAEVSKAIGSYSGKKPNTRKKTLEKSQHPISNLVLVWRKINFSLTKIIYPLIRCLETNRLYGNYVTHTATGRITMHEPNIQMVPKDFTICDPVTNVDVLISCRNAFSAPDEHILVAADYCQLELRVLTYLSQDELLMDIMRKPGDIFLSIAAKWNNVTEESVDEDMRQNTKQLCYGIIYGMGAKTLAEQLEISEDDALYFMETFRSTYPGIKKFIKETVAFCTSAGYVETITGRRRFLPHITNSNLSAKNHAERQAVNTIVQGSAADIVKNAMVNIEDKINTVFKKTRHKPKLTLHLHDELIYEVPNKYLDKTVKIIKIGMENSAAMFGAFPVKVKTGKSWGTLKEYL